ncbi:MAG TPA: rRNA maturation RNase YbeY [Candidatus Dormibacteraeota bacterium]|nr:rRNA maturation RNase YbeY [Candidatus Dormibacteraeota bacterium]
MQGLVINFFGALPARAHCKKIKTAVLRLQDLLKIPTQGNINLKFVDDAAMTVLNKQYNGRGASTDVLSFSYIENSPAGATEELGDVIISVETARRQAKEYGIDLTSELALLAVHGALHVLGYDHNDTAGRESMSRLQSEAVKAAGLKYREFEWK